jgi:hypothetical protein
MGERISNHILLPASVRMENNINLEPFAANAGIEALYNFQTLAINGLDHLMTSAAVKEKIDIFHAVDMYNPSKYFGHLALTETNADFDYHDKTTHFYLHEGEKFVGIHLQTDRRKLEKFSDVTNALHRAAQYLWIYRDKVRAEFVVGMTYPKLAHATRRYGFTVPETPLPDHIQADISSYLKKHLPDCKYPNDEIMLSFLSIDDLISRYAI